MKTSRSTLTRFRCGRDHESGQRSHDNHLPKTAGQRRYGLLAGIAVSQCELALSGPGQSPNRYFFSIRTPGRLGLDEPCAACCVGTAAGIILNDVHMDYPAEAIITSRIASVDHSMFVAGRGNAVAELLNTPIGVGEAGPEHGGFGDVIDSGK